MLPLTTEALTGMLALIGTVILISGLLSGLVERKNVPQVGIFLLLGLMLGPMGLGILRIGLDSPILRVVATLSLALVLFTDALGLRLSEMKRNAGLATAILGPGTLVAAGIMAVAGHFMLGLDWPHAAILAAALASTDPVILRGLLRRPGLPPSSALALRLESGLNDVVLLPIVLIAMAFAGSSGGHGVSPGMLLFQMFVLGPVAGLVIAYSAIKALDVIRTRIGIKRDYESLFSIGICLAAFSAAESLHGSGFLAAFAAGIAVSAQSVELCDCFQEYGETTAEMLLMFTFVLLGASLIWTGLAGMGVILAVFLLIALLARPLALYLTLLPFRMEEKSRRIIAWFGPRGLSTLLLALVPAFAEVPGSVEIFHHSAALVLLSVVVHGASIMMFKGEPEATPEREAAPVSGLWSVDQLREAMATEPLHLVDVRSMRHYDESDQDLLGALRIDPGQAVTDLTRHDLPKDAIIALFCACPADETSIRIAEQLHKAGWERAVPIQKGWESMTAAGFATVRRVLVS